MNAVPKVVTDTRTALTLFQSDKVNEAQALLEQVCKTRAALPMSWFLLATIHFQLGKRAEAKHGYEQAIRLDPGYAEAYNNLGVIAEQQHDTAQAAACYRKAIARKADYASAHFNLANCCQQLSDATAAEAHYRKAIAIDAGYENALNNLGLLLQRQGRHDEAVTFFNRALALAPEDPELLNNLGYTLYSTGKLDDAIRYYRCAIELDPNRAEVWNNIAIALQDEGQYEDAVACFTNALSISPAYAEAHSNLGTTYQKMGRYADAVACCKTALDHNPRYMEAYNNLAIAYRKQGDWEASNHSLQSALSIDATHKESRYNTALNALALGDFTTGWHHYVARPHMWHPDAPLPPDALPKDLAGKRVLLEKSQGIGDEIFFLRFARQLKSRGPWICYLTERKLAPLLQRLDLIDEVVTNNEAIEYDLRLSVADLPGLLLQEGCEPTPHPVVLAPLAERRINVIEQLHTLGPPPYIGVTWRGGTKARNLLFKEIPVSEIASALPANGTLLALQREPKEDELAALANAVGRPVHNLSAFNDDLEDILALLDLLDEYIGVSNANMHLRAGLGKRCRVLVPHPPEWRWLAQGDVSPWFPCFDVYRQAVSGDWQEALQRLKRELLFTRRREGTKQNP